MGGGGGGEARSESAAVGGRAVAPDPSPSASARPAASTEQPQRAHQVQVALVCRALVRRPGSRHSARVVLADRHVDLHHSPGHHHAGTRLAPAGEAGGGRRVSALARGVCLGPGHVPWAEGGFAWLAGCAAVCCAAVCCATCRVVSCSVLWCAAGQCRCSPALGAFLGNCLGSLRLPELHKRGALGLAGRLVLDQTASAHPAERLRAQAQAGGARVCACARAGARENATSTRRVGSASLLRN